jgi:hypothetical protein
MEDVGTERVKDAFLHFRNPREILAGVVKLR